MSGLRHTPAALPSEKRDLVPIVWEAGWAPAKNHALTGIRSPNRTPSQVKARTAMALKEKKGLKKDQTREDETQNNECWKK